MVRGFTQYIGLAVVVALALAAVFGSMSLANPAMAQDPPDDTVSMYTGLIKIYDAGPLFSDVTKASGITNTAITATQSPLAVLTGTDSQITGAGNAGKFGLSHAAEFTAGVTVKEVTITFSLDPDGAGDEEAVEKKVDVTVMPSVAAARATTGSGADTRNVDIGEMSEGDVSAADGSITTDNPGMVTLYTGDTMYVDVGKAYKSGQGAGKILGYGVDISSGATASFTIEDTVKSGTSHGMVEAGPDGMASLKAGDVDETPLTDQNLTVQAYCANTDGTDTLALCTGTAIEAMAIVNVKAHTEAERVGNIDAEVINVGESKSIDVSDNFKDGNGSDGAIVAYSASSATPEVVVAYYDSSTEMVVVRGLKEGGALVTVTAVDNVNPASNPTQIISVVVVADDAPMPGAVEMQEAPQSLMAMASMASGQAVPTIGRISLSWQAPSSMPEGKMIAAYEFRDRQQGSSYPDEWARVALDDDRLTMMNGTYYIDRVDLVDGKVYDVQVRAVYNDDDPATMDVDESTMGPPATYTVLVPSAPTFEADDYEPGKNSWYTLQFSINKVFNGGADTMTIKLEAFGVPSSISTGGIAIVATEPASSNNFDADPESKDYNSIEEITFNPASIAVDGKEITMTFPDVRPEGDITKKTFDAGTNFKVIIYQSAGISNPTASRVYGGNGSNGSARGSAHEDREIFVAFSGVNVPAKLWLSQSATSTEGVLVPRLVQLSEEDGGLGDMVTATALGFENGGTLHFFLDKKDAKGKPNGRLNPGEDVLCSVPSVSGNMGSCEFEVTTPTFSSGINYVNAVDGDGKVVQVAYDPGDPTGLDNDFELKASIKATPAGGSPGEIMQVQLVSFTNNAVTAVKLSGNYICGGDTPDAGTTYDSDETCAAVLGNVGIGSQGNASISVTVPNWAVAGSQELVVEAGNEDDDVKVVIVGPRIVSTPATVVANQRVSLVGTGFSPDSVIGRAIPGQLQIARISIGGDDIHWSRVNNNRVVEVDDGGNWSASVDLPLSDATTGTGDRKIRITDSKGRTGSVDVTLAERDFDITPPEGRVGTIAVVRGHGYPSKNDEGTSFTVDVVYNVQEGTSTRVSVVPDASGRFEVELRIPTTAPIPSTNQVEVKFELEDKTEVLENKQHTVPEGIIKLSETSGGPGSTITVSGEGYKAFVNVDSVKIGTFDVTPSPKPHTNGNGMMEFAILIPGIDVGIQTIEVQVGGTTSSVGFTVTASGVNPGDIVEVGKGLEDLGDNLESIWHFNNDTKAWTFYDGLEGSDLSLLITGETYLIQIKATQEVILNRETRNLTCNEAGNCWNQIVW